MLETFDVNFDLPGKRVKATARFFDEADARRAVEQANLSEITIYEPEMKSTSTQETGRRSRRWVAMPLGRRGHLDAKVKITVKLVYAARLRVSETLFGAVKDRIADANVDWRGQNLLFISYEPSKGYRVLRIEGEDRDAVAAAKGRLECILDGQILLIEEKPMWGPGFFRNGPAVRMVQNLETQLGVTIICDQRRRKVHYYGPAVKSQDVLKELTPFTDATTSRSISLDQNQFLWAFRRGFKAISAAVPDSTMSFDVVSTPKRILVQGSNRDYDVVCQMLCWLEDFSRVASTSSDGEDCSICWTPAENPVRTRCDHCYCADCFEMFCLAGTRPGKGGRVGVRCEGDSGQCCVPLSLDELEEHLPSTTFEDLLEASFKAHVSSRPKEFRTCCTPDCDQVYRVTPTPGIFTCGRCIKSCCTSCHVHHPGRSCNETEDDALAKIMSRLNIKKCPECETLMEKTEGCNHMTCGGCKAHICWVCLKTFKTARDCYGHMNRAHGSFV